MGGRLFVGTSGFAFKGWKGPFYPAGLKDREMLAFYASRLPSVEINYTFRRHPSEKTLANWREQTPDGFEFALKAHQRITHTLRLAAAGEAVDRFLQAARLLGPRLGPILFQCPPSLRFDRDLILSFLDTVPPEVRAAFEFRHPSWDEARPLLAERGTAWCVAETDETPAPEGPVADGSLAYLRLRKTSYSDEEMGAWAARVGGALRGDADVFCYFKHEEEGAGPAFAERLAGLVPPAGRRS